MKCASCGYYNLPNVTVCGRCQRSLSPATASVDMHFIDIYPPRARDRPKTWRLQIWWQRASQSLPHPRIDSATRANIRRSLIASAGIVPGLGAALNRRHPEAIAQSIAAAALLALFAATIHADISNFFGTCFLLLLVYCQFDTLRLTYPVPDDAKRKMLRLTRYAAASTAIIALTLFVAINLAGTLYLVGTDGLEPTMHRGDTMVVRNSPKVKRGEVVAANLGGSANRNGDSRIPVQGLMVERVLGLPGDTLAVHAGTLSVNGAPIARHALPLGHLRNSDESMVTVPPGSVCLWRPNIDAVRGADSPFMLIDNSSIVGRVAAVLSPAQDRHIMK